MKLCECGCGTQVMKRFAQGHNARGVLKRGGLSKTPHGYILVLRRGHPRAFSNNYVYEHILIAEKALGHPLSAQSCIHHVNEIKSDNQNCNLVICEDDAYHMLLHRRTDAYNATGSVHALRCTYCGEWGFLEANNMNRVVRRDGKIGHSYHRACTQLRDRNYKENHPCNPTRSTS